MLIWKKIFHDQFFCDNIKKELQLHVWFTNIIITLEIKIVFLYFVGSLQLEVPNFFFLSVCRCTMRPAMIFRKIGTLYPRAITRAHDSALLNFQFPFAIAARQKKMFSTTTYFLLYPDFRLKKSKRKVSSSNWKVFLLLFKKKVQY